MIRQSADQLMPLKFLTNKLIEILVDDVMLNRLEFNDLLSEQ